MTRPMLRACAAALALAVTVLLPSAALAAPANDAFGSAPALGPALPFSAVGSNEDATIEPGEPSHVYGDPETSAYSVWWTWTPVAGGAVTLDTCGSAFDTMLAVYTGTSFDTGLTEVTSNDDTESCGEDSYQSRVSFTATAGTTYRIVLAGYDDVEYGSFTLKATGTSDGGGTNGDSDGDGLADGSDCAPNDSARPNRNGTDANCDGVVDVVALTLVGGAANRTYTGGGLGDTFTGGIGSETFRGMAGNDRGRGNRGNDRLYGGLGTDWNDGGPGADYVFGEAGNDTSYGGTGADIVNGGPGTDLSRGGYGNDRVYCGPGLRDRAFGDAGDDTIGCYDRSGGDLLDGGLGRRDVCVGDRRDVFRNCERIIRR